MMYRQMKRITFIALVELLGRIETAKASPWSILTTSSGLVELNGLSRERWTSWTFQQRWERGQSMTRKAVDVGVAGVREAQKVRAIVSNKAKAKNTKTQIVKGVIITMAKV